MFIIINLLSSSCYLFYFFLAYLHFGRPKMYFKNCKRSKMLTFLSYNKVYGDTVNAKILKKITVKMCN